MDVVSLLWRRVGKVRALAALALVVALVGGLVVANWDSGKKADPVNTAADAALPRCLRRLVGQPERRAGL